MEIIKKLFRTVHKISVSPLLILFLLTTEKKIISSDVKRWCRVESLYKDSRFTYRQLLTLLASYKEFRNLYYFRLVKGNNLAAIITYAAKIIYRQSPTLFIEKACTIGPGLFIQHGYCTGVLADIGENCWINQHVSLGHSDETGIPRIGDNVKISVGAIVLGDISIGNNVIVAASSLVTRDIPDNCVVGGVPARVLRKIDESDYPHSSASFNL